jgi:hypothetical protein
LPLEVAKHLVHPLGRMIDLKPIPVRQGHSERFELAAARNARGVLSKVSACMAISVPPSTRYAADFHDRNIQVVRNLLNRVAPGEQGTNQLLLPLLPTLFARFLPNTGLPQVCEWKHAPNLSRSRCVNRRINNSSTNSTTRLAKHPVAKPVKCCGAHENQIGLPPNSGFSRGLTAAHLFAPAPQEGSCSRRSNEEASKS